MMARVTDPTTLIDVDPDSPVAPYEQVRASVTALVRSRRDAETNPYAQLAGSKDVDELLRRSRLRDDGRLREDRDALDVVEVGVGDQHPEAFGAQVGDGDSEHLELAGELRRVNEHHVRA